MKPAPMQHRAASLPCPWVQCPTLDSDPRASAPQILAQYRRYVLRAMGGIGGLVGEEYDCERHRVAGRERGTREERADGRAARELGCSLTPLLPLAGDSDAAGVLSM